MADDLKIRAGADTGDFETGMARIQKVAAKTEGSLENLAKEAKVAGNAITAINSPANATSAALAKTAVSANKMDSALGKGAKGGAQATVALTNLGRVAQDVPFGFVGIANNLNPLLESFQRLKAESGSTGGALKALGSSLMGAGGLGLALSALTAIMTFSQLGMTMWSRKTKEAKEEADGLAAAVKEQEQSFKSIVTSLAQEQTSVLSMISVLRNETETRERKNIALEKLQKINPEIFGQLKVEDGLVSGLTNAYDAYVKSLEAALRVKVLQKKAELEIEKIFEAEEKRNKTFAQSRVTLAQEAAIAGKLGINQTQIHTKLLRDQQKQEVSLTNEIEVRKQTLEGLFRLISEQSKGIDLSKNEAGKKNKKEVKSLIDVLSDLENKLKAIDAIDAAFGTSSYKEKISEIESAVKKLITDFKVSPDDAIINKLLYGGKMQNIDGFKIPGAKSLENQIKELLKTSISRPVDVTIPVLPTFEFKPIDTDAFLKALRAQELNEGITSIFSSLSQTIVDGFGDMLTSIASFGNVGNAFGGFFKGILNSLGNMVQQLGKQTLLVQLLIKKLKALFGSAAGIGASLGLIALGAVIKGIGARINVPRFADGVEYFRGGVALVGEREPELVELPTGSRVIPNYALNNGISGAGSIEVTGNIVARGSDLVVIFDRANRSLNRIG